MAGRKGSTKREAFGPLYRSFIARLKALGCVFCPTCYAYLPAEHAHVDAVELRKVA